jgi:hypothetical protein
MMESVSSAPLDLHLLQNYVAFGAITGTSVSISLIYCGTQFRIKFEKQRRRQHETLSLYVSRKSVWNS